MKTLKINRAIAVANVCLVNIVLIVAPLNWTWAQPVRDSLTLAVYLDQVRDKNEGLKSSRDSALAAALEAEESRLLIHPNFYLSLAYRDSQQPGTLYPVQDTAAGTYTMGVTETTPYGLAGSLHYDLNTIAYTNFGFSSSTLMSPSFSQGSPTIELTLSLWRNRGGAEISNQVELGAASVEAKKHQQAFAQQSLLAQAESAYWVVNLAREVVKIAKDSVERAQLLVEWNYKKSEIGLADHAELLQAQAALEAHKVELKNAENDLVTANRNFNSFRGIESDLIPENLQTIKANQFANLQLPAKMDDREDVKAALAQSYVAKKTAQASLQKYKPTLELFGAAATNNTNPANTSTVYQDSFNNSKPTYQIGIRLSAPLDFSTVSNVKSGYLKDQLAAEEDLKKKKFDESVAWTDLQDRYKQNVNMLSLYEKLEKVQFEKLENERQRRSKGRTTTQQVLNFELDYEQAQLSKIRVMSDMLQLIAQMKLYGGAQ